MPVSPDVLDRARSRVGKTIGSKWTLDDVLGIGGMATVYAATHRNKSRAAVKMLHAEISIDQTVRQRFLREGYVANTVNHSGTVKVLDDDVTEDGAAYIVMELLLGETLEARRERKGGTLPVSEVLALTGQLLDVLASAHAAGIVHRDLKPENLFLTDEGRLKVLDFGIARIRELSNSTGAGTQTGSLLGTPAFMAPEQALGRSEIVDHTTDLWAAGATMFTLLTDRCVHEAQTVQEQLVYAATRAAPSIGAVMPTLAPPIVKLVDKALAFDKADRFQSAHEMRDALRAALTDALPNGPVSLLLGPSSSRDSAAPPPQQVVAKSGSVRPPSPTAETLATGRPHVFDTPPPSRTSGRKVPPLFIGIAAVSAIALGVGAFFLGRTGRVDPPPSSSATTDAAHVPATPPSAPAASKEEPKADPPKTDPPKVEPVKTDPPSAPQPPTTKTTKKGPDAPPPPPPTTKAGGGDPFNKRF